MVPLFHWSVRKTDEESFELRGKRSLMGAASNHPFHNSPTSLRANSNGNPSDHTRDRSKECRWPIYGKPERNHCGRWPFSPINTEFGRRAVTEAEEFSKSRVL